MTNIRSLLKNNPFLKKFSSVKIAVVCLSLLFILTFWGTVAQVHQGLYQSQERFFYSWGFLAAGFIPFPGAQLVLWILFINLLSVAITRFVYRLSHLGILITHMGLLLYFVSAFVTFHVTQESNVTLMEGEGTNVSTSYADWELSVWEKQASERKKVLAYDVKNLKSGQTLSFNKFGFNLSVKNFYPNAEAYTSIPEKANHPFLNNSGIQSLTAIKMNKEPEKNLPGGIFKIVLNQKKEMPDLILFGGETTPSSFKVDKKEYDLMLRRKRRPLPFMITLEDFEMERHPGTEVARSYKSRVEIEHDGLTREVLISMNNPLRYKDYTLYQASYSIDELGREASTLAVVKNSGRILPYVASLLTFLGLFVHFLVMRFVKFKV